MADGKRYYEDLEEGRIEESSYYTVSRDEIQEFAQKYDPQSFHTDEVAAEDSRFRELIASGIHIMAIWRRLDYEFSHDIDWICVVAWDEVKFLRPLRSGDTVFARARCLSKRVSRKDPSRGVVVYEYTLLKRDGQIVWSCRSTNLVERRDVKDVKHRKHDH